MEMLVDYLVNQGVLSSPRVIRAFQMVDRKDFVSPRDYAYVDAPLPIIAGQTISQPTTVAFMLEMLDVFPGMRVLDVGSGSGWTTALLAALVGPRGEVQGVEIVPELVQYGRTNLSKYDMAWAGIHQAIPDLLGYPGGAPYDRILVSAEATQLPYSLINQLRIGGKMVVPIGKSVLLVQKNEEGVRTREYPGFAFVPLRE